MNANLVTIERDAAVGVIIIENPPVNAMSPGVPRAIMDSISALNNDKAVASIVLTGGGKGNIAGADIRFQGKDWPAGEPTLRDLIVDLEKSAKPVVAALGPNTLGGGLEIAMACHYRVISAEGKVGQPEVTLGIPPGAGGTQRLPRLAPVEIALDMIVSGKSIEAGTALKHGVVDRIFDTELVASAKEFANEICQQAQHVATRNKSLPRFDQVLFDDVRKAAKVKYRGLHAPQVCIDCVEAAFGLPFDEGLKFERSQFAECVVSDEAAALRHVFFAERQAGRIALKTQNTPLDVRRIGVIGAGTMGSGIAIALLKSGFTITLVDSSATSLEKGVGRVNAALDTDVERGRLTAERRQQLVPQFDVSNSLENLVGVDLVIEAVFEDLSVKKAIFSQLGRLLPEVVLATNTSYLDIDAIAEAAGQSKENVVGMHFFSPANIMRLLEVVRGRNTSDHALQTALTVAKRAGKSAIVAGNCHGFIANRLYACYQREAHFLIEEGALPEQVDKAITAFGFAMGPFAVADLAGLDIGWANRKAMASVRDPSKRYAIVADKICERGWFGQKTGRGFYQYPEGVRRGVVDPEITDLILAASNELGIERRNIDDAEIVERCILAIINEGANVLSEGIAERASDIDLAWLYGYGFPRWRGGPMYYAEKLGLDNVLDRIVFQDKARDFWDPSAFLCRLVEQERQSFP